MKKQISGFLLTAGMLTAFLPAGSLLPLPCHAAAVPTVSVCGVSLSAEMPRLTEDILPWVSGSAHWNPDTGVLTLDHFEGMAEDASPCIQYSGNVQMQVIGKTTLDTEGVCILLEGEGNLSVHGVSPDAHLRLTGGEAGICTYSSASSGGFAIADLTLTISSGGDGIDSGRAVSVTDSRITIDADRDGIEVETEGLSISRTLVQISSREDGLDIDGTAENRYPITISDGSVVEIACTVGQNSGYGIDYDTNTLQIQDSLVSIQTITGAFSPESPAPLLSDGLQLTHAETNASVCAALPGDIDGNGTLTPADATLLQRYFAGYAPVIRYAPAHLDNDGLLTRRDAMILARSLAGWDGYTLPYGN